MPSNLRVRVRRALKALFGHRYLIQYRNDATRSGGQMACGSWSAALAQAAEWKSRGDAVRIFEKTPNGITIERDEHHGVIQRLDPDIPVHFLCPAPRAD
jgi:hypothetical protein